MQCIPRASTSTVERKVIRAYFDDDDDDDNLTHSFTDRPDTGSLEPPLSLIKSVTETGTIGLILDKEEAHTTIIGGETKKGSLIETIQTMDQRRERKDRRGKPIIKGRKQHRITFKDEVLPGERVASIVFVESYKQFNVDMSTRPSEKCCRVL